MKVFNFFAHVIAIFAFLTLGSLLVIVALHILPYEDAIVQLRELYSAPFRSFQTGILGVVFIFVGLVFTRMLLKKRKPQEAMIFQSEMGPVVVSGTAIEDTVKKVLKRFHLVKEAKLKVLIHGKDVEIRIRLSLWSGSQVQELLVEIQEEARARLRKMLGTLSHIEISCDVEHIEDHDAENRESGSREMAPIE